MRFALLEAKLAIANIVKNYILLPSKEVFDYELDPKATIAYPKNPVFAKVKRRLWSFNLRRRKAYYFLSFKTFVQDAFLSLILNLLVMMLLLGAFECKVIMFLICWDTCIFTLSSSSNIHSFIQLICDFIRQIFDNVG